MRTVHKGSASPAIPANSTRQQLDRELAELERRKLVALRGGTATLTLDGYIAIAKRFPRRRS
jgi:hypothetical protein